MHLVELGLLALLYLSHILWCIIFFFIGFNTFSVYLLTKKKKKEKEKQCTRLNWAKIMFHRSHIVRGVSENQ